MQQGGREGGEISVITIRQVVDTTVSSQLPLQSHFSWELSGHFAPSCKPDQSVPEVDILPGNHHLFIRVKFQSFNVEPSLSVSAFKGN